MSKTLSEQLFELTLPTKEDPPEAPGDVIDNIGSSISRVPELWMPQLLVLGPGGIKGFLELGALLCFEKEELLKDVTKYVGVSVGAVIGLMLVAGYTVSEIIADALETNLLQDISSINLTNIKANKGLISNQLVKDRLILRMKEKFGMVPTLNQLYQATGITYVAVTTNLDKFRAEHLSWETEPTLSCVEAALLSMNIPIFFYRLKYRGCVYIDGAFSDPYPIHKYDDGKTDILGIYITTERPETHVPVDTNVLLYLYKTIDIPMSQMRKIACEGSSSRCKHLELFANTMDTAGLITTKDEKTQMIHNGYYAAQKFLSMLDQPDEVLIYNSEEPVAKEPLETNEPLESNERIESNEISESIESNELV